MIILRGGWRLAPAGADVRSRAMLAMIIAILAVMVALPLGGPTVAGGTTAAVTADSFAGPSVDPIAAAAHPPPLRVAPDRHEGPLRPGPSTPLTALLVVAVTAGLLRAITSTSPPSSTAVRSPIPGISHSHWNPVPLRV